jgi:multidrug efflux pump subunit AcrA (membrane-fusion protein)
LWGTVYVVAAAPVTTASGLAFFEVTVDLEPTDLPPLIVGMPVTAHLQTGSRSLAEYLFGPISQRLGTALTEP